MGILEETRDGLIARHTYLDKYAQNNRVRRLQAVSRAISSVNEYVKLNTAGVLSDKTIENMCGLINSALIDV